MNFHWPWSKSNEEPREHYSLFSELFQSMPRLETDRLVLRRTMNEDAPAFFEMGADREIGRLSLSPVIDSLSVAKRSIQTLHQTAHLGEPVPWAMVDKKTGEWIGAIGISNVFADGRTARVGFAIRRGFWGKGYTTEALRTIIDFLFERTGVNRIDAFCFVENVASRRVMEKSGMLQEGVMRDYIYAGHEVFDTVVFAILRSDWEANRSAAEPRK